MRAWSRSRPPLFRTRRGLVAAILILAAVAAAVAWLHPGSEPLAGAAYVIDGDTLRIGSVRIRLLGIDAPELDQTCTDGEGREWACGSEALSFVEALLRRREVSCDRSGRDRYGRALARCSVDGTDLGASIVQAGWAVAELEYASAELDAHLARRGIWMGRFEDPADWRRDHGTAQPGLWEWLRSWFQ